MNNDAEMRAYAATLPAPEFDDPAWVTPPALADATVAICTTAGLHLDGDTGWGPTDDPAYKRLPSDARNLKLAHWSPNFDRVGLAADLNVGYPADRLVEMAAENEIAGVGPHHVSFTGNQDDTVSRVRLDTGPRAAAELKAEGVDVVLLVPI